MSTRRARRWSAGWSAVAFATVLAFAGRIVCAQSQPELPAASPDEFRRLLDAKEYDKAAAQALELVSAAEQHPGPAGEDLQVALMNLALAQYLGEDYLGAETSYLRVIALIEASGHMTGPRLARAQAGLATTYFAGKRYDLAAARYEQAIALARREEGLFTEAQIPFLENYAAALTELNRIDDAQRAHRYILRTVERKYGVGSLRYAQELESLGRWYARIGAYDASRLALRDAIGIVEAAMGGNAAELIGPLTALADCARRQLLDPAAARAESADDQRRAIMRDPMAPIVPMVSSSTLAAEGQDALERAVAIAGSQKPPSQLQIADVRTLLGDWYQSRQQPDKALASYQFAWQAGSDATTTSGKSVTELLFGRPVLLAYTPPGTWNRYASRPPEEVTLRSAQVSLTVTARGRVADPKVVSDAGDPKRGAQALRAAQSAIYRPRFVQGAPIDTPGVTIDQPFYVLVEKEDEPAPAPDKSGG